MGQNQGGTDSFSKASGGLPQTQGTRALTLNAGPRSSATIYVTSHRHWRVAGPRGPSVPVHCLERGLRQLPGSWHSTGMWPEIPGLHPSTQTAKVSNDSKRFKSRRTTQDAENKQITWHVGAGRAPPLPPRGLQFGTQTMSAQNRRREVFWSGFLRGAQPGSPGGQSCRGRHRPSTQMRTYARPSGPPPPLSRKVPPGKAGMWEKAGFQGSVLWGWAGEGDSVPGGRGRPSQEQGACDQGARAGHGPQHWGGCSLPPPLQPSRGLFSDLGHRCGSPRRAGQGEGSETFRTSLKLSECREGPSPLPHLSCTLCLPEALQISSGWRHLWSLLCASWGLVLLQGQNQDSTFQREEPRERKGREQSWVDAGSPGQSPSCADGELEPVLGLGRKRSGLVDATEVGAGHPDRSDRFPKQAQT